MQPVTVTIQGITPDLVHADGEFGVRATYGLQTPQEVVDFFARIQHLQAPAGDDVCPAAVTIEGNGQTFDFTMEGGQVFCLSTGTYVAPQQIPDLLTSPPMAGAVRQHAQGESGVQPVRMPEVPPTDPELSGRDIDMGPASPQVAFRIPKEHDSISNPMVTGGFGVVFAALGAYIAVSSSVGGGMMFGVMGAGLIWLGRWLKARAMILIRYGFDWRTNTFWSYEEGDHQAGFFPDANLITGFSIGQESFQDSEHIEGNTFTVKWWRLEATRVDGSRDFFIRHIYRKKDAHRILAAVQGLLAQQR